MTGRTVLSRVLLVARWAAALAAVWLGSTLAFGTYLAAAFADHPWPGEQRDPAMMIVYRVLTAVLIVTPMVLWWFLIPRWRWGGIVVTPPFAALTFGALIGVFN